MNSPPLFNDAEITSTTTATLILNNFNNFNNNPYRQATVTAWQICGPILISVGTLGNLMSFIVLCTASFKKTSLGLFLKILSVVDTSLLWTVLFRTVVLHQDITKSNDIRNYSEVFCRGHFVSAYFLSHLSSWTIATLSAERAFAIARTLAGNGSRRNTIVCFVVLATFLLAVDAHLMKFVRFEVFYERQPGCEDSLSFENISSIATQISVKDSSLIPSLSSRISTLLKPFPFDAEASMEPSSESTTVSKDEPFEVEDDECHVKMEHKFCWLELGLLHRQLWQWVDALLFALAPFIVIIVSNVIVARSIIKADKFRSSFLPTPNFETGTRFIRKKPFANDKSTLRRVSEEGCTRNLVFSRGTEAFEIQGQDKHESKKRFLSKRAKSSTIMLLVVSLTFLVTTTPLIIYIIVVNLTNDVSMEFTGCLCSLFYYAGNCTNFLQYCLSGSKFRKSLKMVLKLAKIRVQAVWLRLQNMCCLRCFGDNQVSRHQNVVTPTRKTTEKFSLTFQDASQKIR